MSLEIPRVPEFYRNQRILVTGGTGTIGKAVIEKLLRSCPDLDSIYVIIRSNGDKTPRQRWEETAKMKVFDFLRSNRPELLDKVVVLEGDIKQRRLGMSDEDYRRLQKEVTIVFHGAASVRFNDPLPDAVFINTRGTLEIVNLALGMRNLKVLVHVSTSYCNPLQSKTDERVYPPPADWRDVIKTVENLDRRQVIVLQQKCLSGYPNTYTFSKNLAESLVWEFRDKIPIVIARPSIVSTAIKDPYPGYLDFLNGAAAIALGTAFGFIRTLNVPKEGGGYQDYVPIDDAAKALVLSPWYRSNRLWEFSPGQKGKLDEGCVVNLTNQYTAFSTCEGLDMGKLSTIRAPPNVCQVFQDRLFYIESRRVYRIVSVFLHLVPALILNSVLKLTKYRKMDALKIAVKVDITLNALNHFMRMRWLFPNKHLMRMNGFLNPEDREEFELGNFKLNLLHFLTYSFIVIKEKSGIDYSVKYTTRHSIMRCVENLGMALLIFKLFPPTYNFLSEAVSSNLCYL